MPTIPVLLTLGFAVSAAVTVGAHARDHRPLVYVFKPLSTILLLLLAAAGPSGLSSTYSVAVVAGLFFSLAGDVFLMLPSGLFRSGLASFLLAHLCYVYAFLDDSPFAVPVLPFVVCFAVGASVVPAFWAGVPAGLRPPVAVYVAVLLVMVSQGSGRSLHLNTAPALSAALGAALFVLSDFLLAWNRFRKPLPAGQALIHGTYFPAQWLIAISTYAAWPGA